MIRSSRLVGCCLGLCLLLGAAPPASAQWRERHRNPEFLNSPQVPEVLRTAITAGARARYTGRRTVQFWRDMKNPRHDEIVIRDGQKTRIEFPEGSKFQGQIIVEDAVERRHYFPERNEVMISPPRHEESEQRLFRLAQRGSRGNVVLSTAPGERVAGYSTEQVLVADRQGNVLQRLYIEPRTGVLLKRDVFDPGGARIGSFEFTQIELDPPAIDPSVFRFERKGVRVVTPYDELRKIAGKNRFLPFSLPTSTGYRLDEVRMAHPHGEDVLVQVYVSRHGKLSLFELRSQVSPERLREFARDELHASSWQANGFTFVLVGSLDQTQLDRLAQAAANGTR